MPLTIAAAGGDYTVYFESAPGIFLGDALNNLRDACSADSLYGPEIPADLAEESLRRDEGAYRQYMLGRQATMLAAFACEGYANEFIDRHCEGLGLTGDEIKDLKKKFSPIDKYVVLPALIGRPLGLTRGTEPVQQLQKLIGLRNELAHPKRGDRTENIYKRLIMREEFRPPTVARSIVAVANAALALQEAPGGWIANRISEQAAMILQVAADACDAGESEVTQLLPRDLAPPDGRPPAVDPSG